MPQFLGFLADRGYAVAAIDYRLAPKHTWPAPQEDVFKALQYLADNAARLGIDPSRFALFGRSAGGQIASASALNLQDSRIRAVIAFYSPFDMRFAWKYGEPDDVLNSLSLLRDYLGGTPEEQPQGYESASAYLRIDGSRSVPFLLVHGKMDTLVWVRQSQRFATKLAQLGQPQSYVELGWGTHAFDHNLHGPSGQISTFAVTRFLRDAFREKDAADARPETSSGPNALPR